MVSGGGRPARQASSLFLDGADGDRIEVAVERQADDRNHLIFDLHRNGDVHLVFAAQAGNHRTVELSPGYTHHDLVSVDRTGDDVEALAFCAVEELARIATAFLADDGRHGLLEDADPACAVE